jgi:hypothetical protein
MTILQHSIAQAAAAAGGYQIARSLRFNSADGAYLNRTFSTPTNQKKWTWSGWIKRSSLNSNGTILFSTGGSGGAQTYITYGGAITTGTAADGLNLFGAPSGDNINVYGNAVYRDLSAFANVVFSVDTTQATAANRVRIYVNGIEISYATSTYPTLNQDLKINSAYSHAIGATTSLDSWSYFNAYVADVRFIDGQQLDATSFGEFDTNTGVWNPKTYSGTYGTNGFWLKFDDNSNNTAATLGKDSSGNSNNWTPNNFSVTAGVGNDSLVDTPTNYGTDTGVGGEVRGNYATFNPLVAAGGTHANGNLDYTAADNGLTTPTTLFPSSGKWYCEIVWNSGANPRIGVTNTAGIGGNLGSSANSWANLYDGRLYYNSSVTSYGVGISTGDVVMMALDIDAGKLWYGKNGTWMASGDPATGANPSQTFTANQAMSFAVSSGGGTPNWTGNFGQRAFAYTAPSGFKALCTQNLPTPAIGATSSTLAGKNFNVVTYTGDGTNSRSITGVGFQPDLVWVKSRSNTYDHQLVDAVRGGGKELYSNLTNAESTLNTIPSFGADGFTVNGGTYAGSNGNGATFVGWAFKGANTTVSNTSGSITSTVSANPTAGISVVGYTGNNTAGATVGHGLGVAPKMIIAKSRGSENWGVYHHVLGATNGLLLNSDGGSISAAWWNSAAPTSSTFSLSSGSGITNSNGVNYIAYCFAEVTGFSKFGSYTGNGSADGAFVYCGFRPRYVIIKSTGANGWITIDAVRNSYNVSNSVLFPHAAAAEDSSGTFPTIDFLSNGFKLRNAANEGNASGATYIFAAFAEAPFNYARAR